MKEYIKLNIQAWQDREAIIVALTNSGYKVWLKIEDKDNEKFYYVYIDK